MPRTQVKLSGGDVLTVDSLAGLVRLNALRSFLADGFQTHLQVHFCCCICLPDALPDENCAQRQHAGGLPCGWKPCLRSQR